MSLLYIQYHVSVNGKLVGLITPGPGLLLGDPLSPYLFIIYTEGLFVMLNQAEAKGDMHGCCVGNIFKYGLLLIDFLF